MLSSFYIRINQIYLVDAIDSAAEPWNEEIVIYPHKKRTKSCTKEIISNCIQYGNIKYARLLYDQRTRYYGNNTKEILTEIEQSIIDLFENNLQTLR